MLAVQSPIQREKSLRSARRLHVDVVVGQPGSGALHPLCTARTRGGLHIRISGGPTCGRFLDGRPVITMMWCASVPSHSGTGVSRGMVLCDELNAGGARERSSSMAIRRTSWWTRDIGTNSYPDYPA